MLPTTGFFKNIDCPFYESSCERPYCHFKHRKKTQESTEPVNTVPPEVPTYNPTPKSQLASARSHIPISYVPDLAIRTDRNFRSISSYGYSGGDKPTYKPTPLSILSTGKINSIKNNEDTNYTPNAIPSDSEETQNKFNSKEENSHDHEDSNDINFEDLETEFDMIDEIINAGNDELNGESKENDADKTTSNENDKLLTSESAKSKHKSSNSSSRNSHKSKHNESSSSKGKSDNSKKSKHRSHSSSSSSNSHKEKSSISSSSTNNKSQSKHNNDKKDSKSSKSSSRDDRKSSRSKEKKNEFKDNKKQASRDKDKHKHKESSRHSHKSKTKERDKDKKSEDKKKQKESSRLKEKLETNSDEFNDDPDIEDDIMNYDNEDSEAEDTLEECYKIFTEYKPTEPELFPELKKLETNSDENSATSYSKKQRVAHENADKVKSKVLFNKPKYVPTAAHMMVNRLKAARLAHANNEQNNIMTEVYKHIAKRPSETPPNNNAKIIKTSRNTKPSTSSSTSSSLIDDIISGKSATSTTSKPRRIAPVQNVDSIQRAKAKLQEIAKLNAINATKTASQSLQKGAKRTAHAPEYSVIDVPEVLGAERSKLPINVRSRYLTMILDECAKLYLSKEEAQQRALNEEYKCYERCAVLATYRNSAMLAINRLRKEIQEREIQGLGPIFPGETADTSKNSPNDLNGHKFYENIKKFILSDEELVLHGFPREGKMPGRAIVKNQKKVSKGYMEENDRICCRCLKLYKVDDDGFAVYEEECLYHPLKKRTFRGESIYLCCRSSDDTGCVTAATHVCESDNSIDGEIEGYQTTMPPDRKDDPRSYEVFALDCEMCYTTKGLELTRVTIVNSELKTVYETLVKPLNAIIDYNTRFSGITEEQMNRTATSILQVQANILHLCNSNTILIGHSLESDMKALKIIHNTIVDTSVLFPHKFGLPHKRALRDLAREYLKKIIQNDINGHDSAEDALTCMELVQWKVKEELKARGIKV